MGNYMFKLRNFFKSNPEILTFIMFVLGALLTVYITNNYFGVFAPFIISFVVVILLRPLMVFFEKRLCEAYTNNTWYKQKCGSYDHWYIDKNSLF